MSQIQHRAYSLLNVKSVDGEKRIITGTATTPTTDRMGDIVEPLGVQFTNPLPLLLYHDSKRPVGLVTFKKPTSKGIDFEAQLPMVDEPGTVKDRVEEAWQSVKLGLLAGVSIGFRSIEEAYNKDSGGYRFIKTEVYELSLVSVPAQPDATIATVKSLDRTLDLGLAALGKEPSNVHASGVSDTSRAKKRATDRSMKKSYADQIAQWEETKKAKETRMAAILEKSAEDGVTLDEAEETEHDELEAEIKKIDAQIARLKSAQEREVAAAKAVTVEDGTPARRPASAQRITVEKKLPPGFGYARMVMCYLGAKGNEYAALELAKTAFPDDSALHAALRVKAAVGAGATVTSHWADDLVPYNVLQNDFVEYLRPGSILGKFGQPIPGSTGNYPSLRKVPFNVRSSGASAGLSGYWVGEGKPAPFSKMTTFNVMLTWAKIEAMTALTREEIRFSNPNAEMVVRDDIAKAVNQRADIDFVDPALAAVANVSPASITYGIAATAPTGTAATNVRKDLATMLSQYAVGKLDTSDVVLIMSASMATQISMMVNTLGNDDFPSLTMAGGRLRGIPVIVSEYLTAVGSPSTQTIVAVKASEVYLADDGNVNVEASSEASAEMLDGSLVQDGTAGTGTSLVSAFQSGLVFFKAQREINWKLRRSTAVQYISPAAYAAA